MIERDEIYDVLQFFQSDLHKYVNENFDRSYSTSITYRLPNNRRMVLRSRINNTRDDYYCKLAIPKACKNNRHFILFFSDFIREVSLKEEFSGINRVVVEDLEYDGNHKTIKNNIDIDDEFRVNTSPASFSYIPESKNDLEQFVENVNKMISQLEQVKDIDLVSSAERVSVNFYFSLPEVASQKYDSY